MFAIAVEMEIGIRIRDRGGKVSGTQSARREEKRREKKREVWGNECDRQESGISLSQRAQ